MMVEEADSGAPTVNVCSHSATFASSTAIDVLVDAIDAALQHHAADDMAVVELV